MRWSGEILFCLSEDEHSLQVQLDIVFLGFFSQNKGSVFYHNYRYPSYIFLHTEILYRVSLKSGNYINYTLFYRHSLSKELTFFSGGMPKEVYLMLNTDAKLD